MTITAPAATLAIQEYIIDTEALTWSPNSSSTDWSVTTTPTTHNLCGDVALQPQYNNVDISGGEPITYDSINNEFTVESDEADLIDTEQTY